MVTGDDTPAGGINANGYGPFQDQLTDEQQTVRTNNATGGTFTLTFKGQTTAPIPYNATAPQIDAALEALSTVGANNIQTNPATGGNASTAVVNVYFRRALAGADQPLLDGQRRRSHRHQPDRSGRHGTFNNGILGNPYPLDGGMTPRATGDDRRSTLNTNDLRGKILRIKVKDNVTAADANKADYTTAGTGTGAYTIPAGNLYPVVNGAPTPKTKAEVYAMGFRNPYRIQVDENDVAYISDYSPDANTPQRSRGPSGVGRFEIVRKPSNYGYPLCYSSKLGYYKWNFLEFLPNTTTVGFPGDNPEPSTAATPPVWSTTRVWCVTAARASSPAWR